MLGTVPLPKTIFTYRQKPQKTCWTLELLCSFCNNAIDYKWSFVAYSSPCALLCVPRGECGITGLSHSGQQHFWAPAAGQKFTMLNDKCKIMEPPLPNDPTRRQCWCLFGERWDRTKDLTWERNLQTHTHTHIHTLYTSTYYYPGSYIIFIFWKTWTIGQSVNVSNLHNSTCWLQPVTTSYT